jgi:hypothetical protein
MFSHLTCQVVDYCLAQSRSNYVRTLSAIRRNAPGLAHRCCITVDCMWARRLWWQRLFRTRLADFRGTPWCFFGMLGDIIQPLFCSRQITWFSTTFSSRRVSDRHPLFWHLPVSGSSTWIECLNSCLRVIQIDAQPFKQQKNSLISFVHFSGSSS